MDDNIPMEEKISKEKAIEVATQSALEWYEEEGEQQPVELIGVEPDNDDWVVTFKVYGWLTSEWRAFEYEGKYYADIIGG